MMDDVKTRATTALLVLSLLLLAILACGYTGRVGLQIERNPQIGPNPSYRELSISAEEGRIRCWYQIWPPQANGPTGMKLEPRLHLLPLRPPDVKRSLWEFDAHWLRLLKGSNVFILAFPIWCVALPCLIGSALWLRRRRRQSKHGHGFPVFAIATDTN
jgi:hypothetical protein